MLRIAIVDPSDVTREPLLHLLHGVDSVWIEAESKRYEAFLDIVQQYDPEAVIVSLDADQTKSLALISQLTAEYANLPILAISGRGDGQTILHALRAGAREFLTQPVVLEELLKALRRLTDTGDTSKEKTTSKVVSVLGSRGGVGCTSIAVNLGCSLAQDKQNSVALLDLDLALGDVDVTLDFIPSSTIADVAQNVARLDMQFLKSQLYQHSTGLAVLPHPMHVQDLDLIHEEHLQRVISLMRASYTHLILDLSKSFSVNDLTSLRMSDVILLITQLELTSLRNTVRILDRINAEEGLIERVKVVLNRVGSDFTEGNISLAKAEETIDQKIYWQIPNDYKAMMGSRIDGIPLIQHSPKCKSQSSIQELADALCGKEAKAPAAPVKKSGWWGR